MNQEERKIANEIIEKSKELIEKVENRNKEFGEELNNELRKNIVYLRKYTS